MSNSLSVNLDKKKAEARKWYLANREITIARAIAWNKNHKDKAYAFGLRWKRNHPEKGRAYSLKWHRENRERALAKMRKYALENPEREKKRRLKWRLDNPNARKIWRSNNPEKEIQYKHRRRAKLADLPNEDCSKKIKLLKRITRFCHWCCFPMSQDSVTIDHVISLNRGGHHINDNLVGCCKSCNSSKLDKPVHEWLPTIQSA